jgi:hypothetical protein
MSPTDSMTSLSPSTPRTQEEKSFRELDLVRDELGSLHRSEVRAPEGDEHLLAARVLDQLGQKSFREQLGSSRADRARVLALAFGQQRRVFASETSQERIELGRHRAPRFRSAR